jgi:alpha-N-arabinofuranosidase
VNGWFSQVMSTLLAFAASSPAQIHIDRANPPQSTIEIRADQPIGSVSRRIFGSFLEPIGNSINGGLSAEILQNPSLEDGLWSASKVIAMVRDQPALAEATDLGLPLPWEPFNPQQGRRYQPHWGTALNSWRSLEIMGLPGESVGIKQTVYLPVQRTLRYKGSLYAKHLSGGTEIVLSVNRLNSLTPLTTANINATAPEWKKYEFTLSLPSGSLRRLEPADFAITVHSDERVEIDEISLQPEDAIDGLDPDEVSMAKAMHVSILRFGGNFTSAYNWRDGIGPQDKRISILNAPWGIPEYNTFGTDEFLQFCRLIGAQPQVALNLGTGTPAEAAAWVRYIKDHYPGKVVWELGNELYGKWQAGYPSLQELPQRTTAFSEAVRKVDPDAELIATGQTPWDNFRLFNSAELSTPAGTFHYLSTHFIRNTNAVLLQNPSPDFLAISAFALPIALGRTLEQMQAHINEFPNFAKKTHLALTEWLFTSRGPAPRSDNDLAPSFMNMGGAVMAAGIFNMLMRHSDIVPIANMTGIMEFAGIWKKRSQVFGTPAYYAFRMYSNADTDHLVNVETNTGSYSVHNGTVGVPEISNVPYLDAVATLNANGSQLTLFCINRSLTEALDTKIQLHGFDATPLAHVEVLKAQSIYEMNDEIDPQHILPVPLTLTVRSSQASYEFPPASVTVVTFHRRS